MTAMSAKQRGIIFGYAKQLGIDIDKEGKNDELHDLVECITGKRSISQLSAYEAEQVINRLGANLYGFKDQNNKVKTTDRWKLYAFGLKDRPGMATLKQLEFIRAMILELSKLTPGEAPLDKRLRGWLEKYAKTSDIMFLTPGSARKVIEGLKRYLEKLGWKYTERN